MGFATRVNKLYTVIPTNEHQNTIGRKSSSVTYSKTCVSIHSMANSSFVQFFKNAIKFVVVIGAFFLFGYLELQYKCGFVVAIAIGLYLFRSGARILSTVLLASNIAASLYAIKPLVVLSFLALNSAVFFADVKATDDTKVILRPYESEVRSILFRYEPSLLHTVDTLLDEHEGREKELIYKLTMQYEGTPKKTPSKSSNKKPETPGNNINNNNSQKSDEGSGMWRNISGKSPGGHQNNASTSYANTVMKIKNILRTKDPALFKSVDRMLEEYQGREADLLREVQEEYEYEVPRAGTGPGFSPTGKYTSQDNTTFETNPQQQQPEEPYHSAYAYEHNPRSPAAAAVDTAAVYASHDSYRTLDGRPAVRLSLDRAVGAPYIWRADSGGATPQDLHSVESAYAHGEAPRPAPFSPTSRALSGNGGGGGNGGFNPSPRQGTGTGTGNNKLGGGSAAYREELAQAPYLNSEADTPRRYSATINSNNTAATNATTNTTTARAAATANPISYRNSVVAQAQEEARREMQARIEARWGPKPVIGSQGNLGVQKRHGYNYGD